jgi:hypothetical protein
MKDISQVTACVVTTGLFQPLAHCLATKCKRVFICSPDIYPSVKKDITGRGFDGEISRVREIWQMKSQIDLFCFPDCSQPGLQLELESQGFPVWGSRNGVELELDREKLMRTLQDVGLTVPEFTVCEGWENLRHHLRDKEDQFIKISRYRGDMETFHWRNWAMDEGWLDWLAYTFGPSKHKMRWIVFPKIETDLEIGGDTYCVRGRWPRLMLNGYEFKDTTYFSAVTKRKEMPEQIQEIIEAITPLMERYNYRNQISFEDRVKGDKHYWIDATQRAGMPSSGTQQLIWKNFPEIVWAGANGELMEPEPAGQFSLECMVTADAGHTEWIAAEFDPELFPWLRLSECGRVDGVHVFPQDHKDTGELGWLVAIGNTPKETLERAKELADLLPDGCDAKLENLVGLVKEVESGEEEGIPFTDQPIPTPGEVVADD